MVHSTSKNVVGFVTQKRLRKTDLNSGTEKVLHITLGKSMQIISGISGKVWRL